MFKFKKTQHKTIEEVDYDDMTDEESDNERDKLVKAVYKAINEM